MRVCYLHAFYRRYAILWTLLACANSTAVGGEQETVVSGVATRPDSCQDVDVDAVVDDHLSRIRSMDSIDGWRPDPAIPWELRKYWNEILYGSGHEFYAMMRACRNQQEEAIIAYWNEFRTGNAQARFRWQMGCEETFFPASNGKPYSESHKDFVPGSFAQRVAAEIQVKEFLEDPGVLREYYQVVAWRRQLFVNWPANRFTDRGGRSNVWRVSREVSKHIGDSDSPNYWIYARMFLLYAHATGRLDIVADKESSELAGAFEEWHDWLSENGGYLRPLADEPVWKIDEAAQEEGRSNAAWTEFRELPELNWPAFPFNCWNGIPPIANGSESPVW